VTPGRPAHTAAELASRLEELPETLTHSFNLGMADVYPRSSGKVRSSVVARRGKQRLLELGILKSLTKSKYRNRISEQNRHRPRYDFSLKARTCTTPVLCIYLLERVFVCVFVSVCLYLCLFCLPSVCLYVKVAAILLGSGLSDDTVSVKYCASFGTGGLGFASLRW
jgi:hypothetical protein